MNSSTDGSGASVWSRATVWPFSAGGAEVPPSSPTQVEQRGTGPPLFASAELLVLSVQPAATSASSAAATERRACQGSVRRRRGCEERSLGRKERRAPVAGSAGVSTLPPNLRPRAEPT